MKFNVFDEAGKFIGTATEITKVPIVNIIVIFLFLCVFFVYALFRLTFVGFSNISEGKVGQGLLYLAFPIFVVTIGIVTNIPTKPLTRLDTAPLTMEVTLDSCDLPRCISGKTDYVRIKVVNISQHNFRITYVQNIPPIEHTDDYNKYCIGPKLPHKVKPGESVLVYCDAGKSLQYVDDPCVTFDFSPYIYTEEPMIIPRICKKLDRPAPPVDFSAKLIPCNDEYARCEYNERSKYMVELNIINSFEHQIFVREFIVPNLNSLELNCGNYSYNFTIDPMSSLDAYCVDFYEHNEENFQKVCMDYEVWYTSTNYFEYTLCNPLVGN